MKRIIMFIVLSLIILINSSCSIINDIKSALLPTPGKNFNATAEFNKSKNIFSHDNNEDALPISIDADNGDSISVIEAIEVSSVIIGQKIVISSGIISSKLSNLSAVTIGLRGLNDIDMGKSKPVTINGKTASLKNIELDTSDLGSGTYTITVWAKNETITDPQVPLVEVYVNINPVETINNHAQTTLRVIDIAIGELDYEEGNNNHNKYAEWYGSLQNQPWCAIFVSWCFSAADILDTIGDKFAYCPTGWEWYKKNNRAHYRKDGYIPQPGDLIFYDRSKRDTAESHVGLVLGVIDNNVVYSIEGNVGDAVREQWHYLNEEIITGYGQNNLTENDPTQTDREKYYTFNDVYTDMWYANSIKYVTDKEYMSVDDYGNFRPTTSLTRAEAWEVIAKMNGTSTSGGNPWFFWTTEWVRQSKISDGTNPERATTRQEVAVFLYNYIGQPSNDGALNAIDANEVDSSMRHAMSWALSAGVIEGYEGKILPMQTVTRGDYADIISKFIDVAGDQVPREELMEIAPSLAGKIAEINSYEVVVGKTGTGQGDYFELEGSVWAYEGDYLTKINIIRDGDWENTYEPIGDGVNSLGQEIKLSDFNTRKDGTKMFDIMYHDYGTFTYRIFASSGKFKEPIEIGRFDVSYVEANVEVANTSLVFLSDSISPQNLGIKSNANISIEWISGDKNTLEINLDNGSVNPKKANILTSDVVWKFNVCVYGKKVAVEVKQQGRQMPSSEGAKGRVVFLTYGLGDSLSCFIETINNLSDISNKFIDFGYVSVTARDQLNNEALIISEFIPSENYKDIVKTKEFTNLGNNFELITLINKLTSNGYTLLIRTGLSDNNLSFFAQLNEMKSMISIFDGYDANTVFIGHSMGGLTSINYAIDYAKRYKSKQVDIITIDTPFHKNNYAMLVYTDATGKLAEKAGQVRGLAHRDLGGIDDLQGNNALRVLKNKWQNQKLSNLSVYTIAVSMYSTEEPNTSTKGDGIVDIPSQQGEEWNNINNKRFDIIYGEGIGEWGAGSPIDVWKNSSSPYFHNNTPKLLRVAEYISDFLK
jgi:hypothetical protein